MNHIHASRVILLFLVLSCLQSAAAAQTDKVDDYVKAQMDLQKIPGLSIAVLRNGEIVKAKGYGLANVELNVPAKAETVYQSGSMGKQFTATAVMMLVEEGKIALDDKINKYFPYSPESWNNITIRNLLTHTAGTTDYPKDFDFRRDYSEAELLKKAQAIPLAFAPGEKWSYSIDDKLTIVVLINRAGASPGNIAHGIAGRHSPDSSSGRRPRGKANQMTS